MVARFRERLSRLADLMRESDISGAIVSPGSNLLYLTGLSPAATLERLFTLLVSSEGEVSLLAPKLYENELRGTWIEDVRIWSDSEDPYEMMREIIERMFGRAGSIAVDDQMQAVHLLRLYGFLRKYDLRPLSQLISRLRMVKDEEELRLMREASRMADETIERLMSEDLRGRREREVVRMIESLLMELGADRSFDAIVASGPNGANPHHTPGERRISEGDVLIIDFGARYRGYCSDITRTFSIGRPSERLIEVYEVVREAQERAFQSVREGALAGEVDAAARGFIASRGYGERFTHRTGHGLGLDIHEEPYIAPNSGTELREGMVFTIEPGIYLEGSFGVRIEDDVAIVGGRGERLTRTTRELIRL
ncbi:MAG: aminopeptidase P family protein [Candidatus Korarchaeota archaeon NZ13-K]|nr:MAG: aminopeptidase P family protein [Candidatus Korarchaeota archaeon NZ13-K]